ncbi:YsnF/AvaK domain-containing protein [Bacillus sp. ISL-7]|uniref:YsnF/AvaK domain-containing protein n=1 Tax=Bacillus sp. ISL-7 TaxID=2819136 RepID=UPI001BE930E5|nr:YsnF/AvaK domain-containing protein [Bacillus sp. ISL-7]MBT2737559.1 YsnF/AvaK domain-containing protein [Bacillus sp. ISL-7]
MPEKKTEHQEDKTIQLHKEELQVNKKWVVTADVRVYKKTYTLEKQIVVPIIREELIIEKKILNPESGTTTQIETTQIPLCEDRIEVILNPTILNDVEIFRNQFEEIIQINENVKEEKVQIDTIGDVKVVVDDKL